MFVYTTYTVIYIYHIHKYSITCLPVSIKVFQSLSSIHSSICVSPYPNDL